MSLLNGVKIPHTEGLLFKLFDAMESNNYRDSEIYVNQLFEVLEEDSSLKDELKPLLVEILDEVSRIKKFELEKEKLIDSIVNFK